MSCPNVSIRPRMNLSGIETFVDSSSVLCNTGENIKPAPRMSISGDYRLSSPIKAFEDKLKDCGNDRKNITLFITFTINIAGLSLS